MSHRTDNQASVATDDDENDIGDSSQFHYNCRYTNAFTVLRDWLKCNTIGQQSKFNLVSNLENFVVSCWRMQQTSVREMTDTVSGGALNSTQSIPGIFKPFWPELLASSSNPKSLRLRPGKNVEAEIKAEVKAATLVCTQVC